MSLVVALVALGLLVAFTRFGLVGLALDGGVLFGKLVLVAHEFSSGRSAALGRGLLLWSAPDCHTPSRCPVPGTNLQGE